MGTAGRGKKRLRALAKWHFCEGDAGARYCQLTCEAGKNGRCRDEETGAPTCPYEKHEPQTDDGEELWDLISGIGTQIIPMTVPTPEGFATRPAGLNFTSILMLGAARHVDMPMLAEILPLIEGSVIHPSDGFDEGGDDDGDA